MNKQVMAVSLLTALLIPATNGFAQFKIASKSAKNLANLDRVVARVTKKPSLLDRVLGYGRPVPTKLPSGLVVPGNAGLLRVELPKTITPVNKSYFNFVQADYNGHKGSSRYRSTVEDFTYAVFEDWIKKSTHNAFYTSQEQLAQDLDSFYHGIAEIFVGPDGRKVKLYALPADGILYKPEGYTTPLVLNANDYFVIYDVVAKTGKIAENKPEVYNLFKHSSEYGEFKLYEVAGVEYWRPVDPQQHYKWNRDLMRNNESRIKDWEQAGYPDQFSSTSELRKALERFYNFGTNVPSVYEPSIGFYFVYELPKPVVLAQPGSEPIKLNPDDYVVLQRVEWYGYENGQPVGFTIIKRQELENSGRFRFE